MAASVTIDHGPVSVGSQFKVVATVAFDSTYPTGGEAVTAAQLRLGSVESASASITDVGGTINVANTKYDRSASKVKLYDETPAEVANAANVEGTKVQVVAFGKSRAK